MFEKFAELFPVLVLWAFGWMLPASVLALVFVHLKRHGYLRPFADLFHAARRLSLVGWLCVAPLVVGLVGYASTKNGGGSTNDAPSHMSAPRRMLRSRTEGWLIPSTPVTDAEIAAGFRAPAEGTVGIVPPPEGAVTNDAWRLRGAHDDAFRPELADWRFPVRDGALTGLTVLARGEIRPDVGTLYFPVPLTNGLSLLPRSRWDLLARAPEAGAQPNGGEPASGGAPVPGAQASVFWHAQSPSNSLLLTWENALAGRDPNCPTNLQAELYSDGRFAWRTDDASRLYLPVFDFDWDGDGLENSVDPDPLVAGPDAHGTNAEWFRTVCSNVFVAVDVPSTAESNIQTILPEGVDFRAEVSSNGVYFVDLVVEQGPAPVYVASGLDSLLGSPVLVACAGETNRVPLVVGIEYAVTSPVPFSVGLPMGGFAELLRDEPTSKTIKWPLEFSFEETEVHGNTRRYSVNVGPYDPGGHFSWETGNMSHGRSSFMGTGRSSPECGCVSVVDGVVTFTCTPSCDCQCDCVAHASYSLVGASFSATGGVCRCGFEDPRPEEESSYEPSLGPRFSIEFSKPAVVFEDTHAEAPGITRPKRSTRVRLTVSAYGGPNGGTFLLVHQNLEKLNAVAEGPIQLPSSMTLAPGQEFHTTCIYEAATASSFCGDVAILGYFVETGTGARINGSGSLTSIMLTVTRKENARGNACPHRHTYGVKELFNCELVPEMSDTVWNFQNGSTGTVVLSTAIVQCPLDASCAPVKLTTQGVTYTPAISVLEPQGIVSEIVSLCTNGVVGVGGAWMYLDVYATPFNVSFGELAAEEIPCTTSAMNGFFAESCPNDCHDRAHGAGRWNSVRPDNRLFRDQVRSYPWWGPFAAGTMQWDVPQGWDAQENVNVELGPEVQVEGIDYHRRFPGYYSFFVSMTESGTVGVRKFGHSVIRTTNNVCVVDGVRLP